MLSSPVAIITILPVKEMGIWRRSIAFPRLQVSKRLSYYSNPILTPEPQDFIHFPEMSVQTKTLFELILEV